MVMLAEHYDFVIGGDPDRDTIDLAILDAGTGRVRAQTADRTDGPAYPRMLAWAASTCSRAPRLGVGGHRQLRCRLGHDAGRGR